MGHQRPPLGNPEAGQPRLPSVGETDWDEQLRRSLAERASQAPVPRADLAGDVLARAGRIRRRRSLSGMAVVVVATLVFGGLLTHSLHPGGEGTGMQPVTGVAGDPFRFPTAPDPELVEDAHLPQALSADLVGEGVSQAPVLATAAGDLIGLPGVGGVVSAHHVHGGWVLISGAPGTLRLWWVAGTGEAPVSVLSGMDALVVRQDRVAWQRGRQLTTGVLVGGQVTDRATTILPEDEIVLADVVGPTVVLRRVSSEPSNAWDVWHPQRGDYVPTWDEDIQWIYGPVGTDGHALGVVPPPEADPTGAGSASSAACLAWWDLSAPPGQELVSVRTSCLPQRLPGTGSGAVSPDGRWLLAGSADGVLLVDLDVLAEQPNDPETVIVLEEVPELTGNPVWLDAQQAVLLTDGALIRVWPARVAASLPDPVERFPLTGSLPVLVQPE